MKLFEAVTRGAIEDVPDEVLERIRGHADMQVVETVEERSGSYRSASDARTLVVASTDGEIQRLSLTLHGRRLEFEAVLGPGRKSAPIVAVMVYASLSFFAVLHQSLVVDAFFAVGIVGLLVALITSNEADRKARVKRRIEELVVDEMAAVYKETHVRVAPLEPTVQLEEDDEVARNRGAR
jgi:hypothetical protein